MKENKNKVHSFLKLNDKTRLAYTSFNQFKNKLGIIFFAGHGSDMQGTKALALEKLTLENNIPFIKFDYYGHGESDGQLNKGNISRWKSNSLEIIQKVSVGPQIIVGSSLGGWLMFLVAKELPEKIRGLIGIAAAPDFTENLIWEKLSLIQKKKLKQMKKIFVENPYNNDPIEYTLDLIEDGKKNLILNKKINLNIPITLLHGMEDKEVPWQTSIKITEKLVNNDAKVTLVKCANHRFSELEQIQLIYNEVLLLYSKVNKIY